MTKLTPQEKVLAAYAVAVRKAQAAVIKAEAALYDRDNDTTQAAYQTAAAAFASTLTAADAAYDVFEASGSRRE